MDNTKRVKVKVAAKFHHTGYGIVTGPHNPASVGCNMFVLESGECGTVFTLNKWHEGHELMAHGGITAAILDEVMGYAGHCREYIQHLPYTPVFTGTATYKYIRPVYCLKEYSAASRIVREEGRKRYVEGEIYNEKGEICVKSEAIYLTAEALRDPDEHVGYMEMTDKDPQYI